MVEMIHPISSVDLRLGSGDWSFEVERRDEIDAYWAQCVRENPALWNGRMLRASLPVIEDGCLSASLVETSFSAYISWRDWGYPDKNQFNLFGSAVIRSREGHLVFGLMAQHTASPGLVYPPGGSLEPGDVDADGHVDVFGSIVRELREETGLEASLAEIEGDFVAWDGQLISVNRVLRYDATASELAGQIREFIAAEANSELEDIVVLERMSDIDTTIVKTYAIATAKHLFDAGD